MQHALVPARSGQFHSAFALRLALRCALVLFAANALFAAVRLADNLVPRPLVATALRAGYADGSMPVDSYPRNGLAGRDMYSDCITAQLALLGGEDALRTAFAPRLLTAEQVGPDSRPVRQYPCRNLRDHLEGRWPHAPAATYTRFWQGSASLLAAALTVMPVDGYRALLLNLTLGLIALCAVLAALAGRELLFALAPLLAGSFLLGGHTGYGQLFSYGPPQVALWAMAAIVIALRDRMTSCRLLPLAVASGAAEAFLDQLISVPLVAGCFLVVAGLVAQHRREAEPASASVGLAMLAGAWVFGFLGTYAAKLGISAALLGYEPVRQFAEQLAFRAGTLDPELGFDGPRHLSRLAMLPDINAALVGNLWRLGYAAPESRVEPLVLLLLGTSGWVAAILARARSVQEQRTRALAAGLPYIAAALFLLLWVVALPEHTIRHAFFMVRSTLPWIVGGWGWYCCVHTLRPGLPEHRSTRIPTDREAAPR